MDAETSLFTKDINKITVSDKHIRNTSTDTLLKAFYFLRLKKMIRNMNFLKRLTIKYYGILFKRVSCSAKNMCYDKGISTADKIVELALLAWAKQHYSTRYGRITYSDRWFPSRKTREILEGHEKHTGIMVYQYLDDKKRLLCEKLCKTSITT